MPDCDIRYYFEWLKKIIKSLDCHVLVVTLLALICSYACVQLQILAELPLSLLGLAVVFPIVFSINAAYKRRERVLESYAKFKRHATALYLAYLDWPDEDSAAIATTTHSILMKLDSNMWDMFADGEAVNVYKQFKKRSRKNIELIKHGVSPAGDSRANQYLKAMLVEFEEMKTVCDYRTPVILRSYSKFFLNAFPLVFAPHFAHLVADGGGYLGYGVAMLYGVVLVCLDNVQTCSKTRSTSKAMMICGLVANGRLWNERLSDKYYKFGYVF